MASGLFGVANPEAELNSVVAQKLPPEPPKRVKAYDQAIDNEFGAIAIGDCLYSASEVIFSLDYDAYREVGTELCERATENSAQEGDNEQLAIQ